MGSGVLRKHRQNDNSTGLTEILSGVPTLTLAGDKDGLYRISRNAEGYFHQIQNVSPESKDKYPLRLLKGVSHGSFMDD